jgi:uncharacterized membrane protein
MQRTKENQRLWSPSVKALILVPAGLLFLGWLLNTPPGLLGKADAISYAVCHRIDLRSFHLGERQLPLCARCTGMYLGAILGMVYQLVLSPRRGGLPPKRIMAVLVALLALFGIDGLNSYFSLLPIGPPLYQPNNILRLFTGTGMGLLIAAALYPAFNQTIWRRWLPDAALRNLRVFGGLLILAVLLDLLVLTGNPLVLYPLALVSAGGVLVLLTMVYSMTWLMVFRSENHFDHSFQLWLPLVGGFILGLIQIGLFDLARYFLTGTWDGFHLG